MPAMNPFEHRPVRLNRYCDNCGNGFSREEYWNTIRG